MVDNINEIHISKDLYAIMNNSSVFKSLIHMIWHFITAE